MSIKVIALEDGFRGGRRYRKGEIFRVPDGSKSKWYKPYAPPKPVEPPEPVAKPPRNAAAAPAPETPTENFADLV